MTETMPGWLSRPPARASRAKSSSWCAVTRSGRTNFTATRRPSEVWSASHTCPMPPWPTRATRRNSPTTLPLARPGAGWGRSARLRKNESVPEGSFSVRTIEPESLFGPRLPGHSPHAAGRTRSVSSRYARKLGDRDAHAARRDLHALPGREGPLGRLRGAGRARGDALGRDAAALQPDRDRRGLEGARLGDRGGELPPVEQPEGEGAAGGRSRRAARGHGSRRPLRFVTGVRSGPRARGTARDQAVADLE